MRVESALRFMSCELPAVPWSSSPASSFLRRQLQNRGCKGQDVSEPSLCKQGPNQQGKLEVNHLRDTHSMRAWSARLPREAPFVLRRHGRHVFAAESQRSTACHRLESYGVLGRGCFLFLPNTLKRGIPRVCLLCGKPISHQPRKLYMLQAGFETTQLASRSTCWT